MVCLRCNEEMIKEGFKNVLIDHCPRCGGVWLDRKELERIVENKKSKTVKNLWYDIKMEHYIEKRFPMINGCQKCGGHIVEYEKDGLLIDRCLSCRGVFFDKKEFEYILSLSTMKGKIKRRIKLMAKRVKKWLTIKS